MTKPIKELLAEAELALSRVYDAFNEDETAGSIRVKTTRTLCDILEVMVAFEEGNIRRREAADRIRKLLLERHDEITNKLKAKDERMEKWKQRQLKNFVV